MALVNGKSIKESDLKQKWREWNKNHPMDQIDWGEYEEEHSTITSDPTNTNIPPLEFNLKDLTFDDVLGKFSWRL